MLDTITANDFQSLLNQKVSIQFEPEKTLDSELISVKEFNNYSPLERKPFSVVLRTKQKNEYYQQGNYILNLPEIGQIVLFLVPIGLDQEGMKYEAIFS